MLRSAILLAIIALLAANTAAYARGVPSWPYAKLLKHSDVVVIAKATKTVETGEVTRKNLWKAKFTGLNTEFTVQAVLKGDQKLQRLTLFHYQLKGFGLEDGPGFVTFRVGGRVVGLVESPKKGGKAGWQVIYLLFLKRRADGRYEAVSGQVDPCLSVREMTPPLR